MSKEYDPDIVSVVDENGKEHIFEELDRIETDTGRYVALLPTAAQRTFSFTVSDGSSNTYSGTAKATLTEGEYVEATGLRLTKQ